ncbi:MAG: hypothetical protein ABI622_04695 [Chloroflexota bacterium]
MNRAISTWGIHAVLRQEELLEEARRERLAVKARRPGRGRVLGRVLHLGRRIGA